MSLLISLRSIDQTIGELDLREGTLKAQLVEAIRSYFPTEESLETVTEIPAEELIVRLWDVRSDKEIRAKRKNLSGLKSSLNKNLRDLIDEGRNPDGIIVGRDNVFVISEEQKDQLIRQLGITPEATHSLTELLGFFKKALTDMVRDHGVSDVHGLLAELESTKRLIEKAGGIGPLEPQPAETDESMEKGPAPAPEPTAPEEAEETVSFAKDEIEILEADEIEEVEEAEEMPAEGAIEGGAPEAETILDEDEVEILEADEIEEVEEAGEIPAEGALEGEAPEAGTILDEEEVEETGAGEIPAEGALEGGAPEAEAILDEEEVEILEADEIEEVEEAGEIPAEGALEGEAPESEAILDEEGIEILEADEIEEVEEAEETGAEEIPAEGGPEGEAPEAEAILDEEEIEILEADEIEEVEETGEAGAGETPAEGGPEGEAPEAETILDEDEVEVLEADEIEEVEEAGAEEIPAEGGLEGEAPEAEAILDEDEIEEVEEIEEDEILEVEEEAESPGVRPGLLEVLSKYIEPEEALSGPTEYLAETHEEYVARLLERFMPKFIKIPAGTYRIGSAHPRPLEQPLHPVRLTAFHIGQFPVTNDLFELFVRETGYQTSAEKAGYGHVFAGRCVDRTDPRTGRAIFTITGASSARRIAGADWRHPAGPGSTIENRHDHPVVQVSREDALAFAAWAGKRLPTEEEWEAAARGDDQRPFPWGNARNAEAGNFESSCIGATAPVNRFMPDSASPFGIGDLLGNVYEWTATPYAPNGGSGPAYVLKGGCWTSKGVTSIGHRRIERGEYWANIIGFRCAV